MNVEMNVEMSKSWPTVWSWENLQGVDPLNISQSIFLNGVKGV